MSIYHNKILNGHIKKVVELREKSEEIWGEFLSKGDESSFAELYDYYSDKLFSYGISLGFEREICKDAVQDVFIT